MTSHMHAIESYTEGTTQLPMSLMKIHTTIFKISQTSHPYTTPAPLPSSKLA
ncbi:hypothetical protein HO173_012875 [Letharia columbiana]|uniref:Uncharacterized protein n=1 Tax=Letharia columbiana TaxID=112416 RepID=A0A8H6FEB5_9LECA|nr:uncharacterized protein HO173_012875 [Letharia columbiana]KAF6224718.1 hypothetical protein HO173_012875 [Letharia columbiana]